jgi:hypothetical protein
VLVCMKPVEDFIVIRVSLQGYGYKVVIILLYDLHRAMREDLGHERG